MRPVHVSIGHFRALRDCGLALTPYTALVGPNGVGKSTVLQAMRFFFDPGAVITEADIHYGCDDEVAATVTLDQLNPREAEQYAPHLDQQGRLIVTKSCEQGHNPRYTIAGRQYPGFAPIRNMESKRDFIRAFGEFLDAEPTFNLKKGRAADDCEAELRRWEAENPDRCIEAAVDFVFDGSTKTQLVPTTRVVYVPAVRDAADELRGPRSPLAQMLAAIVYPRLEENQEYLELRRTVQESYDRIFGIESKGELEDLAGHLTKALAAFVPGAVVDLSWQENEIELPPPGVKPTVSEDGVPTEVERKGHGLQRAMIIALLQAEDEYRRERLATEQDGDVTTHVVLLIEEPELYQHPPRARHFRRVLTGLASRHGSPAAFSVALSTHSPDLVSLEDIDAIRIFRLRKNPEGIPARSVTSVTLRDIASRYGAATGKAIAEEDVLRRLHYVDDVMRESFFADAVVLVEGEGDLGLIAAACALAGVDLEAKGIIVVPCSGKTNIMLAVSILSLFGIKHYAIFDADEGQAAQIAENKAILTLLGIDLKTADVLAVGPTKIEERFSMLKPDAESVLRSDLGDDLYERCTKEAANFYGVSNAAKVLKNPVTARYAIERAHEAGGSAAVFEAIAKKIGQIN